MEELLLEELTALQDGLGEFDDEEERETARVFFDSLKADFFETVKSKFEIK